MTNFERIKNMSVDEMVEFLLDCFGCNGDFDWVYSGIGKMQDPHAKDVYDDISYEDDEVLKVWLTCK